MDTFEKNLQALDAQRLAPLRAAQAELAPVRAALVKGLEAHRRLAAKLSPRVAAARAKFNAAGAVLRYMPSAALYEALARFEDLKTGLDGRYLDLIEKIDHLDERVVYQRGHIELFNAPANCRPANGLEALVERIEFNVQEMEDDLARRAPSAPVVMAVTRSESPAPIRVETAFNLGPATADAQ